MIYVDMLRKIPKRAGFCGWRWERGCHLLADTDDELHAFSRRLGLKRRDVHYGRRVHYDLTAGKRDQALALGAQEADRKTLRRLLCNLN